MVKLGNNWDEILKDEFEKDYYKKIREFLKFEYSHYKIYPEMNDIFSSLKYSDYNEIHRIRRKKGKGSYAERDRCICFIFT